jgi:hypothetical protein
MQRLEGALAEFSIQRPEAGSELRERDAVASATGADTAMRALEGRVSDGFDRLDQNVGAAFSAYSGVLKLAVAALDRSDQNAKQASEPSAKFAPRATETATG